MAEPIVVKLTGDYACFTNPEQPVERISYQVPTPSAMRGCLEAIFWKPEFYWKVLEIQVLKPIETYSIVRNEVQQVADAISAMKGKRIIADQTDGERVRTQRHTLVLKDVSYIVKAEPVVLPHSTDPAGKYRNQFERRVRHGRCFQQPYLGCREFVAYFSEPDGTEKPIDLTQDLGLMLFDLKFDENDKGSPVLFDARIENGIIKVPQDLYEEIREG